MAQQVEDNTKYTGIKLPAIFKVSHYDLTLSPCLKKFTFDGQVTIQCQAGEPTKEVVVNSKNLVISEGFEKPENKILKVTYSKKSETATLEFENVISGDSQLTLKFSGILNDKMEGFYRSGFKIKDHQVYAATTQFEPTDARQCFPCWDEPDRKATFSVTLSYDSQPIALEGENHEIVALSNMPLSCIETDGTKSIAKFQKTPIMSTYLLAFVVGPFQYIEKSDGKRLHRIYVRPGKKDHGVFALDTSCKSLLYYEDFFNIEYPLPKMDQIAIPDFAMGAMENWGLVTYRESCLLVDPQNTPTARKQGIAITVAHEVAHQWFGNLVTMEWWTHLWLNEGFATYMEYLCTDSMYPEMEIWSQFVADTFMRSLDLDALKNSHPIEVPINDPAEINEIFDDISYQKGASVIRMMSNFMGESAFRQGMSVYLSKYKFKNASTENLWEELEKASGKPITKLMKGWTSMKGFPVLKLDYSIDGGEAKLHIEQEKFNADGVMTADEAKQQWMVPIKYITGNRPDAKTAKVQLLESKACELEVDWPQDTWVKLNPGCIDFYRTQYSEDMLKMLIPAIQDKSLSAMDRLGLQNDRFALCLAGKVSTVSVLELLASYKNEDNYNVWSSITASMSRLSTVLADTPYYPKFQAFGRDLYKKVFEEIGWEPKPGESQLESMKRALVVMRLVKLNEPSVVSEAMSKFKDHVSGKAPIQADLRACVYQAVAAYGSDDHFEALFKLYHSSDISEEKTRLACGAACAKDATRLKKVIEFLFSDDVKAQDKPSIIYYLGSSSPNTALSMFKENLVRLKGIYGSNPAMTMIIKACCSNFVTLEKADEVKAIFEDNTVTGSDRTIQQAIETIKTNHQWLQRDSKNIEAYLSQNY